MHVGCLCRPEEDIRLAGTGVTSGSDVGDRDRTWVLCRDSRCSQPLSHAYPKSCLWYGGHPLLSNTLKYACVLI